LGLGQGCSLVIVHPATVIEIILGTVCLDNFNASSFSPRKL